MKTRDQAIVAEISTREQLLVASAESRYVVSLPGMLLRHGLLQTLAFLKRKAASGEDKESKEAQGNRALLELLDRGVSAASGVPGTGLLSPDALASLANQELATYLHIQETAVMVATWIKRLHEARHEVQRALEEAERNREEAR